jgi:tyrosine-protein kinase
VTDTPRYATLRDYLRVLRHHRLLIVLTAIVFGAAGFAVAARQEKTYVAEAKVAPTPVGQGNAQAQITSDRVGRLAVARRVQRALHTKVAPTTLQSVVTAGVETQTGLVVIGARWKEPKFAARVANGFARAIQVITTEQERKRIGAATASIRRRIRNLKFANPATRAGTRAQLKAQLAELESQRELVRPIDVVRFAGVPGAPASPKPLLDTGLGLIVGLALGIFAAFVRDALDRGLRGSREIQEHLDLPLVGHVREEVLGRVPGTDGRGLTDQDLEGFRILRVNLNFVFDPRPRSVAVTSGLPEEGKSTVAVSLATVAALAGRRTLLVECDLRRPSTARRMGIPIAPGLTDYIAGSAELEDVLQEVSIGAARGPNGLGPSGPPTADAGGALVCVPAGVPPEHPAEMLGSTRFQAFLRQVAERFDFVVLDTAPLLSVVDTRELLPYVDGVLLCVRAAKTTDEEARAAKEALAYLPDRPTGVVVTGLRADDEADYGYYSYAYS